MDDVSVTKKQKCCDQSITTTTSVRDGTLLDTDNSNSCSSSMSNLLTEADKAIQESNKRHVKPVIDESRLGIELFIGEANNQFHGLIKTRYADFVVHEIDLDGNVALLTDLEPPIEPESKESLKLEDLFDRKVLVCLSNVNSGLLGSYKIDVTGMDKDTRTSIHHAIKESYERLESSTVSELETQSDENNQATIQQKVNSKNESDQKLDTNEPQELPSSTNDNPTNSNIETPSNECSDDNKEISSEAASKVEEKKYILVVRRSKSSRNRSIWPRGRPDYTHFVLYKENKDTMDAIHNVAAATSSKPSMFTYAGTKDRRAITTQWVSAWRVDPKRLIASMRRFNRRPFIKVGNFAFRNEPIRLGQLKGNRFDLVIRHLVHNKGGQQVIEDSIRLMKENGFVNYFGLQRFGTRSIQTHEIGLAILQSKWGKAIDLILSYRYDESPQTQDTNSADNDNADAFAKQSPQNEAESKQTPVSRSNQKHNKFSNRNADMHNTCIDLWKTKQDADFIFKRYPQFRLTNEGLIIKAISRLPRSNTESSQDYSSVVSSMPRNTRSMYVHSYQSLLWNKLTTYRLKKYGYKVIEGDLVLPPDTNISDSSLDDLLTSSMSGDDANEIHPEGNNNNNNNDNDNANKTMAEDKVQKATSSDDKTKNETTMTTNLADDLHSKIITVQKDDIDKYTIFDVVIPLPGSRVKIPQNEIGQELERLLQEADLTLDSFRAREKVFVAYGSYRKILVKPQNLVWSIKQYSDPRENLIETDLDLLLKQEKNEEPDQRSSSPLKSDSCDEALVLGFDLPPSSYATMCLRELMKKPSTDFNNRF